MIEDFINKVKNMTPEKLTKKLKDAGVNFVPNKAIRIRSPKIIKKLTKDEIKQLSLDLSDIINRLDDISSGNLAHHINSISFLLSCYNIKVKALSKDLSEYISNSLKLLSTISTDTIHRKSQIKSNILYVILQLDKE